MFPSDHREFALSVTGGPLSRVEEVSVSLEVRGGKPPPKPYPFPI